MPCRCLLLPLLVLLLPFGARAQVVGYVDSVVVYRTDTLYFDFGRAELTEEATEKLAALVGDRPDSLSLYVEGHTDAVGSKGANEALAQRRAEASVRAAVALGWPAERVEVRHFGEQQLRVETSGREVRNRRVLLRSGTTRRYVRYRGRIVGPDGEPVPGGVIATGRELADSTFADANGYYTLTLPADEPATLDIYAPGYFFATQRLTPEPAFRDSVLLTVLPSARPGDRMAVPDLYFVSNRTELLKESFTVLPRLKRFVRANPKLRMELAGHVNSPGIPKGPGSWQFRLAQDRARIIYEYMVRAGGSRAILHFKGYSNYEMVVPKPETEWERRVNRRVEIRVLPDPPN